MLYANLEHHVHSGQKIVTFAGSTDTQNLFTGYTDDYWFGYVDGD